MGNANGNEPLGMGGNGIEKDVAAHLYFVDQLDGPRAETSKG